MSLLVKWVFIENWKCILEVLDRSFFFFSAIDEVEDDSTADKENSLPQSSMTRKSFPNIGDYVKLTCQVLSLTKIYYAMVSNGLRTSKILTKNFLGKNFYLHN